MGFLLPNVDFMRMVQESTMTERVEIWEEGALIGLYPCRATSFRLFAEPADPHDANVRSFAEWGFTLPVGTPARVAQTFKMPTRMDQYLQPIEVIIGEVVDGDTWQTAVRAWGNRPKTSTPYLFISIDRYNDDGPPTRLAPQKVQIVFDRVTPAETPIRYQTLGHSAYQGGTVIGDMAFDVQVGDRFMVFGIDDAEYVCFVSEVIPGQPQRVEAKFRMDVGSPR